MPVAKAIYGGKSGKTTDDMLDTISGLIHDRTRLEAEIALLESGRGHFGGDGLCECECHPENHAST